MAENEIVKHTETIYKALKNKEVTWLHKLKEITIEILIIVFAVTISIWFHNWSDELHEKKQEKEFLIGMQKDLQADLVNLEGSLHFYQFALAGDDYFLKVGGGAPVNKDSVNKYAGVFFSSANLEPHASRYEGLKGSDNFNIIENKELLDNIIDLHESIFARIIHLDTYYHDDISNKMVPYVSTTVKLTPAAGIINAGEVVKTSQMRILLITMQSLIKNNILATHLDAIKKCNEISKEIDEDLK
jgi:hypothetical protein